MRAINSLFIILLCFFNFTNAQAENQIYKSIDEQGNTIFSDRKLEQNYEEVEKPNAQTFKAQPIPRKLQKPPKEKPIDYKLFAIIEPQNDSVYHNKIDINVVINVEPTLLPSDKIQLLINGKEYDKANGNLVKNLQLTERGSYQIQAQLENIDGKIIKTSKPITINLKKHSKLFEK